MKQLKPLKHISLHSNILRPNSSYKQNARDATVRMKNFLAFEYDPGTNGTQSSKALLTTDS